MGQEAPPAPCETPPQQEGRVSFLNRIDFDGIKEAALACSRSLLPELVPGGRFERDEYVALNPSRADKNPGSFKINTRTGVWQDFAIGAKGNDVISWYAHSYGLDQSEAARRIAEKLGVSALERNSSKRDNTKPPSKIYPYGEDGPPVGYDEIRRHYYPKNGTPKRKVKIKKRNVPKNKEWTNCYRVVRGNAPVGWQWEKPENYRSVAYAEVGSDTLRFFWPEGEKDTDTLNKFSFTAFTFGGGDGLPSDIDEYLKRIIKNDRKLIIAIDNDIAGRKQGLKKAEKAHACGIKHIRIFDPAAVWSDCPEGGDVTDWFESGGGTREKLIEIVEALPDWQPSASDNATGGDTSTEDDDARTSWDDPDLSLLDDRRGELPPFPLDVFSPVWQEWATNAAHGAGTTVDHVLVPLLSVASGVIGTARRVRASRSWSEPFTMWTAIVGDSGAGKTPGLDVSQRALARIQRDRKHLIGELRRAHESKIESAKAANKQWKAKVQEAIEAGRKGPDMPVDAEIPEAFVPPRLYVSDSTIEKLAVLLQARPQGMLYIRDELAGLFLNLSRYSGGTDKEFWLEAWNGKPYNVERVNRPPVDVQHLLVGVTGGFQPDKLVRSLDGDADGLYARVLFAWPTEAPYQSLTDTVEEVEPEFQNAVSRLIDLAEFVEGKLIIRDVGLTPDAVTTFEQFRQLVHQKKDGLDGRERDWWAKTPAHVLRLTGTLAYLDWAMRSVGTTTPAPITIEARFVGAAVRLVTAYFWPHARAAIRQIGLTESHAKARRVLRWLRAERKDQVSIEDVRRDALQQSLNAEATTKLVEALVQGGWLRKAPIEKSGRGRRARRWAVNPLLWAATANSNATAGEASSEQTRPAEIAGIAEILPANSSEPIPAISAISATGPNSASNDGEATWTL
jgi:hypothetical protein